jgi:serine phosphatase RsbU (regulator of sigma subunit)
VELLDDGVSVLIGVGLEIPHEASSRQLPPGSTLVLYTDGLVETPGRLLDDGIALVEQALRDNAGRPGDELCERLIEAASRRADDIALLLIRLL